MPTIVRAFRFTDGLLDVKLDFHDYGTFRDTIVRQLYFRVGPRAASFYFYGDTHLHGRRVVTSKMLGHFERGRFGVKEARREAEKLAGRLASAGPESKQRLDEAFAEHVARLKRTRSAKWAEIVEGIGRNHILPKFGRWRLDKLARSPRVVREWHQKLTEDAGPVAANHAAKALRAAYMGAAREDTSLPRDRHPCTSVEYNVEEPRQVGITDWKTWRKAWTKIENPTRKAYHLFALLTGCRPGEAARVRWDGLSAKHRTLTIKKSKSGIDVTIPLSLPICRVLRLAKPTKPRTSYIFPARGPKGHVVRFDSDKLPVYANGLRHTYTSLAGALGVDQLTIDLLTTHCPRGVSQKYFLHLIVVSGPAMRKAQARISAEILKRTGFAGRARFSFSF